MDAQLNKFSALVVVVAVAAAVALYAVIGGPDVTENTRQPPHTGDADNADRDSADTKAASVASLLGGLEDRVKQDPGNGKDWLLLAKSYDHLGRSDEALRAYQKAATLGVTDAAFEVKILTATTSQIDSAPGSIRGTVAVAPDAADLIDATDTVFVIARDPDGSPMPLAVIKATAAEFPMSFVLSDENSMVAGRGLSSVESVVVEAKISETGDAFSTKAGLSVHSDPVKPGASSPIVLTLTRPEGASEEGE